MPHDEAADEECRQERTRETSFDRSFLSWAMNRTGDLIRSLRL